MDRRRRGFWFAAAVALTFGCIGRGNTAELEPVRVPLAGRAVDGRGVDDPVVLVTVDGVRWSEIFHGTETARSHAPAVSASSLTPNLHRLGRERGAFIGAPGRGQIAATGPNFVSLPGYSEIFAGRPSAACQNNDCPRTSAPTLFDEARAAGAEVAVFASWGLLARATTPTAGAFHVDCGRSDDPSVDPWPGHDDYRPDRLTAPAALAYLEAHRPDVFFLGLGDPDEYAHRADYDRYVAAIQYADTVIGRLVAVLDRMGERGRRTHVVVTADHGRAREFQHHGGMPEAARVWMMAAGPRFAARGNVVSAHDRHLADIAPTLRRVLGLPADAAANAGRPIEELFAPEDELRSML